MVKHDFHGAQQVKTRVENLIGLAATTGKVESWVFDNVADRLIFDQEMRRRLEENSRFAIVEIGELLIESEKRGYWKADESKSKQLRKIILTMKDQLE